MANCIEAVIGDTVTITRKEYNALISATTRLDDICSIVANDPHKHGYLGFGSLDAIETLLSIYEKEKAAEV